MSLTTRVLLALVAGLALGVLASITQNAALLQMSAWVEPLGTVFINGIRMTIIPLVVSSLIVGITSAPDSRTIGRLGGRALVFIVIAMVFACALGLVAAGPAFSILSIDPAAADALRASAGASASTTAESAQKLQTFSQWFVDLVPANPVRSAADGAMLPLIIFSVAFGVALAQVERERRASVVRVFEAILGASITLVRWVLEFAPIGVFALAVPLATKLGVSAAGALAVYVVVVSTLAALLILLLYPVAAVLGRTDIRAFARAALPAQAMAFSGRSSLAALPAMITATRDTLALPPQIAGFLVPLLSATFRVGAGVGQTTAIIFVAHLYGVSLGPAQMVTVALTTIVASFSIPGIPGGSIIAMVPVLMAAGVPVEGAGILLGVDTIPDMFRTTANITGDMTAAVVLGAREQERGRDSQAAEIA